MRFNPKARVDQSQIEDVGGSGSGGGLGGGGMRLPIPLPGGGGGRMGLGTILIFVLLFVLAQCLGITGGGGSSSTTQQQPTQQQPQTGSSQCQTGADANASDKCAVELFTTSIQDYWARTFPEQTNGKYERIKTVLFSGSTQSACGQASSEMGPFYCPTDRKVYLDSTFFKDMLQGQLGAKGGPFAIGYVVAHEYGHHIENMLGILGKIRTQQGENSDSVKVELMADCLGGMWAKDAQTTKDADGNTIISDLTQDDIKAAIDAAQAVGDDRIQQKSSGRVNPESWTHGSAAQRMAAFNTGLKTGSLQSCNLFG